MDKMAKVIAVRSLRHYFTRSMRFWSVVLFLLLLPATQAQDAPAPGTALGITRHMSIPLNGLLLFDQVASAWKWTFGNEPGGKVLLSDRENGILEGTARINFRSAILPGREESMGTIAYHVKFQIHAGECAAIVSSLVHTGNKNAHRRAVNMGQLMRNEDQVTHAIGMSHIFTVKLHAELRTLAETRINALLQNMEARIRADLED
ncbi:MAG: hypothetical protein KA186_10495 [Flavobacteriales bacterium]|nr:hypothetical protein [Flavobacteriales bacterium]MBP6643509.1 hypothetical protein [Flavobacteriales bacterium]